MPAIIYSFFGLVFVTAGPLSPYSVYAIAGTSLPPIVFWLLGLLILLLGVPMFYFGRQQKG